MEISWQIMSLLIMYIYTTIASSIWLSIFCDYNSVNNDKWGSELDKKH